MIPVFAPTLFMPTGASYTGPGDVIGSATGWWGLRAYSAAMAGTKCIRIVKASDGSAAQDINTLSDGTLDVATINALGYSVKVTKIYDQSGAGLDMVQATLGSMPNLLLNTFGSLPGCWYNDVEGNFMLTAASFTQAQPLSVASVQMRTGGAPVFRRGIIGSGDNALLYAFDQTANNIDMNNGAADVVVACSDAIHAVQWIANGSSSIVNVDTTASTGLNPGTGGPSATTMGFGDRAGTRVTQGYIQELGVWSGAWNSTQYGAMSLNQRTYWGI